MGGAGHRAVPHTADVRIEAWGPSREECVSEAVGAFVETFAEASGPPERTHHALLDATDDADLLAAVLNELIFVLDTTGEVPVTTRLHASQDGAEVEFGLVDARHARQVGSAPKGVSYHELCLDEGPDGWSCSVTLDV